MRIARILRRTHAEGPGVRFALWVQGCALHCPGCYAQSLQPLDGGTEKQPDEIIQEIWTVREKVEGITLLGGEPFLQAAELAQTAAAAQEMGLSVLTFTGFRLEDLQAQGEPDRLALLAYTDVLLDGPYLQQQRDFSRPLVGSRNQRILCLTDRYSQAEILACQNQIEIRIDRAGNILLNGMGDFPEVEARLKSGHFVRGERPYVIQRF